MTTHGYRRTRATPTWEAHRSAINNCHTRKAGGFANYGALGVTVCLRWRGPHGFEHFLEDMGQKPTEQHMLSRRNKSVGFTPANSYWATDREVRRNTRQSTMYTVGTRTQCLVDWAAEHDIPKNTLHYRVVTRGMTMRDALDVGRGTRGKVLP